MVNKIVHPLATAISIINKSVRIHYPAVGDVQTRSVDTHGQPTNFDEGVAQVPLNKTA